MTVQLASALFYPRELVRTQLLQLVAGVLDDPSLDVVQFGAGGGTADRQLAIPFQAAMDEVVVSDASLRLAAQSLELDLQETEYTVTRAPGAADVGVVVALQRPGRLLRIVMDGPAFSSAVKAGPRYAYRYGIATKSGTGGDTMHLVVRTAEPKTGGGFTFGPPIFADDSFQLESPMYAPVLGGLTVTSADGGRLQLDFPATSGSAWLIQFALGDEATELAALDYTATIRSVRVAAGPTNLTLVVPGEDGAADTVLWSYANVLLPEVGAQDVLFAPVAQKRLSGALGKAQSGDVTLPLPLRFQSETAGEVGIKARTLAAQYLVRPLGPDPVERRLGGAWSSLVLDAPATLRPARSELALTARHLGRALNDGSPLPPTALPAAGVRVDAASWAAAAVRFDAPEGTDPGAQLPLVAVQVPLDAGAAAEVALELRGSAAGAPAAALGPPVVAQLEAGTRGWVEFELTEPRPLDTGGDGYWISLRTTKGEVRWFAAGAGAARISVDSGATWGEVDPTLLDAATPLALLFHAVPPPLPAPRIELQLGAVPAGELAPQEAAGDPATFALTAGSLPVGVLDALARTNGAGRTPTELLVFSRAACDLTVESLTLLYDPAGA